MAKERTITRTIAITEVKGVVVRIREGEPQITESVENLVGHYPTTAEALKAIREDYEIHTDTYIKSWLSVLSVHPCYALVEDTEKRFFEQGRVIKTADNPNDLRTKASVEGGQTDNG